MSGGMIAEFSIPCPRHPNTTLDAGIAAGQLAGGPVAELMHSSIAGTVEGTCGAALHHCVKLRAEAEAAQRMHMSRLHEVATHMLRLEIEYLLAFKREQSSWLDD